jgi:hypothetical protein
MDVVLTTYFETRFEEAATYCTGCCALLSRAALRGARMRQPLQIDRQPADHQVDLIGLGGQPLIELAQPLAILLADRVGWHQPRPDLVRDHDQVRLACAMPIE